MRVCLGLHLRGKVLGNVLSVVDGSSFLGRCISVVNESAVSVENHVISESATAFPRFFGKEIYAEARVLETVRRAERKQRRHHVRVRSERQRFPCGNAGSGDDERHLFAFRKRKSAPRRLMTLVSLPRLSW